MKPITVIGLAVLLLFSSCSGRLYSHYSYVKQDKKPAREDPRYKPRVIRTVTASLQSKLPEPAGMSMPVDTLRASVLPAPRSGKAIPVVKNAETIAPSDSTTAVEPRVNKKARLAFWGSFVTIGSFAAAFISPWLLIIPFLLTVLTIIYAFLAIKEIKVSGEYGKPKAEFALFLMIPLLLAEIAFAIILYSIMVNGIPLPPNFINL